MGNVNTEVSLGSLNSYEPEAGAKPRDSLHQLSHKHGYKIAGRLKNKLDL